MNEKLIQETMQLIRLSGHVIEGQLMFEPWSDRAMQFIDGLASQGYSLHAKLPEPLEQELIDWAHKDRHIWALARGYALMIAGAGALSLGACATVKVEAPEKPIEINLNVKIEQEVLIKLDQEIEDLIDANPDIF